MVSGGVGTNLDEWFGGIAEEALAMSEDELSLEEATKGDEATHRAADGTRTHTVYSYCNTVSRTVPSR